MLAIQSATAVGPLQMNGATLSMIVTSPSTCALAMPLASPSTIAVRNASITDIGSSKGEADNLVMTSYPTLKAGRPRRYRAHERAASGQHGQAAWGNRCVDPQNMKSRRVAAMTLMHHSLPQPSAMRGDDAC